MMNGENFVKNTLDNIPTPAPDAKQIIGLVKENGRVTGYKLSDNSVLSKADAVSMAKRAVLAALE